MTTPAIEQLLETARTLHRAGQLAEAEALYRQILSADPQHPEAMHRLGVLAHQAGQHQLALQYIGQAIALNPQAAYYCNQGTVYRALGRLEEAADSYRHGLELQPEDALTHYNLGVALSELEQIAPAIASFQRAVALNPNLAEAHYNLGVQLKKCGEHAAALACFEQVLRLAPDNRQAAYFAAMLSGASQEQAPDSYVAGVFDHAAATFDQHLVQDLHYDTPQRLLELITQTLHPQPASCDVLDLGCGTGLMGQALAPYARTLTGVDLSPKMLAKAQARGLYQRLEQAELTAMMAGETPHSYHLIVAADVFIYAGKLDAIFAEARRLLRDDGLFAFSVEALDALPKAKPGQDYRLNPNGRFAHALAYIQTQAMQNHFEVCSATQSNGRQESNQPVAFWLILLRPV